MKVRHLGFLFFMFLCGCAPAAATKPIQTEEFLQGNFWNKNVVYWFSRALDTFADWFNGEYVLSILLLTIVVRLLILPLNIKQMKSTQEMQKIQPELQKLQQKYKDNPQKLNEERMKLFQQHQINPLSGCLPPLLQMPVLFALFGAISANKRINEHTFLWLELGKPDPYYIIPILAAVTTLIQTLLMTTQQKQAQQGPMQIMMYVFPILIFFMAKGFASAMPIYWVFSTIFTIAQNYFLNRPTEKKEAALKK